MMAISPDQRLGLADHDRAPRDGRGARADADREAHDALDHVRRHRGAPHGDRRPRDLDEPRRAARHPPDCSSCCSAFLFVLLDRERTMTRIAADRRRAVRRRRAAAVGTDPLEPSVDRRRRRCARRRVRGEVVGRLGARGARRLPRRDRCPRAAPRRRAVLADGCRPSGRRDLRAARARRVRGLPRLVDRLARHRRRLRPARRPTRTRRPGCWSWVPLPLQSLWIYHVTMYNSASRITSGHTLREPGVAVAAAASPDRDVLPPRRARRERDARR